MGLPLSVLYRNLAALHGAGIPWATALESALGKPDPEWEEARRRVASGTSVAEALAPVVSPLDLAAIRAGEASGRMEPALRALAQHHEDEERRRRERWASLAYPILLAHIAALLLPIPDLVAGRGAKALLWVALVLVPLYGVLALASAARRRARKDPSLRGAPWARLLLGRASVEEADALALLALGWLHDAGVSLPVARSAARTAGAGGRAAADLEDAERAVSEHRPLSAGGWRRLPEAVRSRLENGEETGTLAAACSEGAAWLDSTAAARRKRFAALLPPVVMLALGGLVAWRVISYYAQLYGSLARF